MKYRPLNKKEQKIVLAFVECNLNIKKPRKGCLSIQIH